MAALYFRDAFAERENRWSWGCQDRLLLLYRKAGGKASPDTVSDPSLVQASLSDEVS